MLVISLLIFSICIGTILLIIHDGDEIHQLVAWLSGFMTIICIFILTPPVAKILLGLFFLIIVNKIISTNKNIT